MPNHCHGIILLPERPNGDEEANAGDRRFQAPSQTLGAVVRGFKSAVTARARREGVLPSFPLWQRNFHDRIIRNDTELERYSFYIEMNPRQWELDRYHETAPAGRSAGS